jgi:hypothetical protein
MEKTTLQHTCDHSKVIANKTDILSLKGNFIILFFSSVTLCLQSKFEAVLSHVCGKFLQIVVNAHDLIWVNEMKHSRTKSDFTH